MALLTRGLVYFTPDLGRRLATSATCCPGFLLIGVGMGFSFVPISIAALAGVQGPEAGLASGLINTSQQIGGALGLAILTTVATTRTEGAARERHRRARGADERLRPRVLGRGRLRASSRSSRRCVVLKRDDLKVTAGEPAPVPV